MDEAERLADRVAIIDHGQLLTLDTPNALKAQLGQGDTLEIEVMDNLPSEEFLKQAFTGLVENIHLDPSNQYIHIRALNAVSALSIILERLTSTGISVGEVHIRPNTLEDVFIQLTGRRLRE